MADDTKKPEVSPAAPAALTEDEVLHFQILRGLYGAEVDRVINFQEVDEQTWQKDKPMWEIALSLPGFAEKAKTFMDNAPAESLLKKHLAEMWGKVNFTFSPVWEILSKLFTPDIAQKCGKSFEAWGKAIEESVRFSPDFEKKIQLLIDDPKLLDNPEFSGKFKEWLKKRVETAKVAAQVQPVVQGAQAARMQLAAQVVSGATATPPASAPTSAPSKAPTSSPSSNPTTPIGAPAVTPPVSGATQNAAPGSQPAAAPGQQKEGAKTDLSKKGLGELFSAIVESAGRLQAMFGGMNITNFLQGVSGKKPDSFSKDEVSKIKVDLYRDMNKPYPSQDKSAEYVARAIGLPVRETPQKMLDAQKNSGMVFETDPGKMKDMKQGDVLYFQKKNVKNEPYAYLCAVVSNSEPLKMKLIPQSGGTPQEVTVKESDYFKNEWYGFVRLPGNAGPAEHVPTAATTDKPPVPERPITTPPATS